MTDPQPSLDPPAGHVSSKGEEWARAFIKFASRHGMPHFSEHVMAIWFTAALETPHEPRPVPDEPFQAASHSARDDPPWPPDDFFQFKGYHTPAPVLAPEHRSIWQRIRDLVKPDEETK